MAAGKLLSIRLVPLLNPSTCWHIVQRNCITKRELLKKMGYPEKPKKPENGYSRFCRAEKASILAKKPNLSFTELSSVLSRNWKALSDSEKQPYNDEYRKEYAAFKVKLEEYMKSLTDKQKEELKYIQKEYNVMKKENTAIRNLKKMKKDLKQPKHPVSPFLVFFREHAVSYPGMLGPEKIKKCSEKWKSLSETEKAKYKELFIKANEQYKKDLQKWENEMFDGGKLELVRVKTLQGKLKNFIHKRDASDR